MPLINRCNYDVKIKIRKKKHIAYDIYIEQGIAKCLPAYLKQNFPHSKAAIITDTVVHRLYGTSLKKHFNKAGITAEIFSVKSGEQSKRLNSIEKLAELMLNKNFDRNDVIIALGGGVVGDIAGFLASVFMRGIPYLQVPTTLLAMVDSSVGGKTGVDMKDGKNLLGTIYQPYAVFIDIDYIKKLPQKQIINGLAEIIKYGVIMDKKLFKYLEKNIDKILKNDKDAMNYIIHRSVRCKVKIVRKDEKDNGIRSLLNYGHTYGHALEKLSGYKLLHGFAISIGMVIANKIAVDKKLLNFKTAQRIKNLLKNTGLPVTTIKKITVKDLLSDKKREGNSIKFIYPVKIGKAVIIKENVKNLPGHN